MIKSFALGCVCVVAFATAAAAQPVVDVLYATSEAAPHPMATASPPENGAFHIVGGGARANWEGAGSLLFNTSPTHGRREWVAQSKDHFSSDPSTVTSYVLYFDDPQRQYEVRAFYSASSASSRSPSARSSVPAGWVLTGGGCSVDWISALGAGSMLTGSYPDVRPNNTADTWVCEARDLASPNPASVIAVAIGVRPAPGARVPMPTMCVASSASATAAHPVAQAPNCAGKDGQITGGGARANAPGANADAGQFLAATFPVDGRAGVTGWEARSKDHLRSSPGMVTAYAIAVTF
jgi:opacity protein-like surface antigen